MNLSPTYSVSHKLSDAIGVIRHLKQSMHKVRLLLLPKRWYHNLVRSEPRAQLRVCVLPPTSYVYAVRAVYTARVYVYSIMSQ